ncbi:hypothetical protein GCK72_009203 [Caenorhabditis remanei]|uniref:CUE domain-containing protein n=1 Tax=Caenorhabditis remanei TaxID=31234 RepID=A0A6A5GZK4_CAERE|nr:hypothetical protein GCK72_009203 [Caenorhabditis remanei]KAF1760950.1 hypothetical protein GCK72_009203 [Caenorhabditis remanei]
MTAQGYYSDTVAQGGPDVEEELLDFDRAMRDFQQMFPNVSPAHIEYVLRKYDGDVSATINELLYDNTPSTPTSSSYFPRGEDVLTRLRRRRHEINERLNENQRFLDRVTDVETARTYEDQQLALLLEHREVNTLISEEKAINSFSKVQIVEAHCIHRCIPHLVVTQTWCVPITHCLRFQQFHARYEPDVILQGRRVLWLDVFFVTLITEKRFPFPNVNTFRPRLLVNRDDFHLTTNGLHLLVGHVVYSE